MSPARFQSASSASHEPIAGMRTTARLMPASRNVLRVAARKRMSIAPVCSGKVKLRSDLVAAALMSARETVGLRILKRGELLVDCAGFLGAVPRREPSPGMLRATEASRRSLLLGITAGPFAGFNI